MDKIVENKKYGEERALYGIKDVTVKNCIFDGEEDGESALKECRSITVENCSFHLRYPIWHAVGVKVYSSLFTDTARAPLWYSTDGYFRDCRIYPVKFLRQCENIIFHSCEIHSDELGWKSKNIEINDSEIEGSYLFLDSEKVLLDRVKMKGKYSFQYMKSVRIRDSILDTKDAFWHSENVVVENCTLKGEYLGWFSRGLTLVNCTMEGCDLSFEYSSVRADVKGRIDSVKNVKDGEIIADSIGEIINEDPIMECNCKITVKKAL